MFFILFKMVNVENRAIVTSNPTWSQSETQDDKNRTEEKVRFLDSELHFRVT